MKEGTRQMKRKKAKCALPVLLVWLILVSGIWNATFLQLSTFWDSPELRIFSEHQTSSKMLVSRRRRLLPSIRNCTAVRDAMENEQLPYASSNAAFLNSTTTVKRPCALLFFGLVKQFHNTVLPSIRKNILETGYNRNCDVFAHTYNVTEIHNSRNHENGSKNDPTEIYELTPNAMIENIEDFERQRNMTHLLQPRFVVHQKHGWTRTSYINMLRQWHSIDQVWNLMEQRERSMSIQYERVGLFRSDVFYFVPIDISKGDAVIPSFGKMTNDRMFYGLYENAYIWANIRFPSVDCYVPPLPTQGLHSEHFMETLILKNIPNWTNKSDICFMRVRGNGLVQLTDCELNYDGPRPWHGHGIGRNAWFHRQKAANEKYHSILNPKSDGSESIVERRL